MHPASVVIVGRSTTRQSATRSTRGRWRAAVLVIVAVATSGCTSLGPRRIPIDRFDYNTAIAASANEQMLLNLVRLRYGEVPMFLAVNSVLTQYVWSGDVGVSASTGEYLDNPAWSVNGSANARYIERPTVTYSPLNGQEFAAQLISPVRVDVVFSLVASGWPPAQMLSMTIQRLNDIQNYSFDGSLVRARESTAEFVRVIELIIELARNNSIELVRGTDSKADESFLEFTSTPAPRIAALIRELKDITGMDQEVSRFRVTRRILGRARDEVTIRTHSLLELMGLLSAGVESSAAPAADSSPAADPSPAAHNAIPMIVTRQQQRPASAFVAVEYEGAWCSISREDAESKRVFGLLTYLFQMQASQNPGAGPVITVPIG